MKKLILTLLVAVSFTACTPEETTPNIYTPINFVDQDWLLGEWWSTDEQDIIQVFSIAIVEHRTYGSVTYSYDQQNSEKITSNSTQFTIKHKHEGLKDFRKLSDTSISLNGEVFLKHW